MYAMTGNAADAQECTQEAYARAWQRWKQVSQVLDPEAWIRMVAWRIAASRWRKSKNHIAALTRHGVSANTDPPSPNHVLLVTALRQLPEHQRRAIVLHHLVGMTVEDIARETGAPIGTIKARLSRGRNALAPSASATATIELSRDALMRADDIRSNNGTGWVETNAAPEIRCVGRNPFCAQQTRLPMLS
jgi:RNA polymerase sigma-70 factor (ECF subfamily)